MKVMKRLISFFVVLSLVMSLGLSAFALELEGEDVVYCNVTIVLSDASGEYPEDAFKVIFKDITGTVTKELKLTKGNSWGNSKSVNYSLPAPTTYNITFDGLHKDYEIRDVFTGEPATTKFAAVDGIKDFYWTIVKKEAPEQSSEGVSTESEATTIDRDNISVVNEEAEKAYSEFLEAVSFIATDESWYNGIAATLNQYGEDSINRKSYSQWYADYVAGGSVEEYFAMSSFEQFLWTETYTKLANAVNSPWGFSHYFESKATFSTYITSLVTNMMTGNNSDVVKEAYLKLMDWQYDYISENGVPFNFINNRSYIEELSGTPTTEAESESEPESEYDSATEEIVSEDEEIQEIIEELEQAGELPEELETEEDSGVWSETLSLLAKNAVTIIVLAVLVVAVLIVIYIRKSKNVDGNQ